MTIDDKNINIDDITFEDMLGEGVDVADSLDTPEEIETPKEEEDGKETFAETSLDSDAESKQEEEEDIVEEEVTTETKTKEDTTEESDDTDEKEKDDSIVAQVLDTLGYEPEKTYEDTTEGLVSMTKDLGGQMAEEQLKELFDKHPLVGKHLEYVLNGGESQNFMTANDPRSDYSKVTIQEEDAQTQKYVLGEYFKMKGHDESFINELLEDYQDTGKLYKKANAAKDALTKAQTEYKQEMIVEQKKEQQVKYTEQKKFWDGVYDTIDTSKEFKGIAVPEREKNKFFNYLSKPVTKEGYTQRDLDHSKADMDSKLAIDYLMFKGFNLDKLIDKKARTKSTIRLKDKIKGHQDTIKSARKTAKRSKGIDIDDLDLSLF